MQHICLVFEKKVTFLFNVTADAKLGMAAKTEQELYQKHIFSFYIWDCGNISFPLAPVQEKSHTFLESNF